VKDNGLVTCPALFVEWTKDWMSQATSAMAQTQGLLPKLTKIELDGSHWGFLDKKQEFGEALVGWLKETFSASAL
jgi:hypothetical protein